MGFRDFEVFNQALLAKQAWRLLTVPNSLCARVLKARYFNNTDFLSASCPRRASFSWRSICHGRALLRDGLIWRIGDGSLVNVWKDNWIPRSGSMKPAGFISNQNVHMVADLLDDDGMNWNEEKLHQTFHASDVDDILQIRVGGAGREDFVAWNYTRNGLFNVRSAYHFRMEQMRCRNDAAESSTASSAATHRGWLQLWGADVPGKVKVHTWRLIKNGLALGAELHRRRIKPGVFCVACGREETAVHRFWRCPHAKMIWNRHKQVQGFPVQDPPVWVESPGDMKNWMLEWLGHACSQEKELILMTLYQIWLARNDARDGKRIEEPSSVADKAWRFLEEWKEIKEPRSTISTRPTGHWLPPEVGWIKANTNGATAMNLGVGGGGAILRDHHGSFVAGACHFFLSISDPEQAELLACRRAVQVASELGVRKLMLETDSQTVAYMLRDRELNRSVHGMLVEEIKMMLELMDGHMVMWARRSTNKAAHILAAEGCRRRLCKTWFQVLPKCISNVVVSELV